MARVVRFSASGASAAGERQAPSGPQPLPRPRLRPSSLVLAVLGACALGCGEDVLVVNWELRSIIDAGLFEQADAGSGNPQSENAESAREAERERDKHDRANDHGE